jgi:hypothetical protein
VSAVTLSEAKGLGWGGVSLRQENVRVPFPSHVVVGPTA